MSQTLVQLEVSECEKVVGSLQAAWRRMLRSSPKPIERATDLQTVLGIHAPLAWHVFNVTQAEDLPTIVSHVPLADPMARVFEAARRKSFGTAAVVEASACFDRFERLVAQHAGEGGRGTFEAMVTGLVGSASEQVDLKIRRAAFRSNAHLWGLQAAATYRCLISELASEGTDPVSVIVQGSRGIMALHPNRNVPICRSMVTTTRNEEVSEQSLPAAVATGLLGQFCSEDLPPMTRVIKGSISHDFVTMGQVGAKAELDVFVGSTFRVALPAEERDLCVESLVPFPCEVYIADLLFPTGHLDPGSAKVSMFGCLEDVAKAEYSSPAHRLPLGIRAAYLGNTIDALHDEALPRCPEMIRHVLRSIQRSRVEYDIFRCRIPYPVLHTNIKLQVLRRV